MLLPRRNLIVGGAALAAYAALPLVSRAAGPLRGVLQQQVRNRPAGGATPIVENHAAGEVNSYGSPFTVPAPPGLTNGDLALVFCGDGLCVDQAENWTAPDGTWVQIWDDHSGALHSSAAFWKIADNEGASWPFVQADNQYGGNYASIRISGANTTPIDDSAYTIATGTDLVAPSATASGSNNLIIRFYAVSYNYAVTAPPSVTEIFNATRTASAYYHSHAGFEADQASSGATGTATATIGTSDVSTAATIVVKP